MLVDAYTGGKGTAELAVQLGVHRNTVQRILKSRGVVLRGRHED
jgi:ActR/RegA family two-component response regulator